MPDRCPDDLGPLEQLARADHPVEGVVVDEEVVHPVDLPGPWRAGGHGDGEGQTFRIAGHELPNDGALADARGSREDEELPGADGGVTS